MCDIEHLLKLYQSGKVSFSAEEGVAFDEIIRIRKRVEAVEGLLILAEQNRARNDAVKDLFVSRGKSVLAELKGERG